MTNEQNLQNPKALVGKADLAAVPAELAGVTVELEVAKLHSPRCDRHGK